MRALKNKKVQKAGAHLALSAGLAVYNKKKYGVNPLDGVKQVANIVRPSRSGASQKISTHV